MPVEIISPFLGMSPRLPAELLPANHAQLATNCYLDRGMLSPAKGPGASIQSLQSNTKAIHWFNREANGGNGYWLQFASAASVMRGQIANDSYLRTYIFGDGAPKYTTSSIATSGGGPYPAVTRSLGLPVPGNFTVVAPTGEPPSGGTRISTSYVVTYVSDLGEEGPPSLASEIVERWDGAAVTLSGLPIASGNFVVSQKRIYRAELNGVFQYVGSVGAAATTFVDSVTSEYLGEPVPSDGWDAPSADIVGAISLPNGVIMGWWGNTLAFCEPYQPHAWPVGYRLALDYDVVGAIATQSGAMVLTKGAPYLITGSTPAGMSQQKIDSVAACLSANSVVDMGEFAIYAGADGLVAAGGMKAEILTGEFITPEQWRSQYQPSQIIGCKFEDYYLGFYPGGSFLFRPGVGFLNFSATAKAVYTDERNGDIYYMDSGNTLRKWAAGAELSYTWKSRKIRLPASSAFTCAKVDALSYPVQFQCYADGALIKNISVTSKKAFRLPNQSRYRTIEIQLSGSSAVLSAQLSTSMSEIT